MEPDTDLEPGAPVPERPAARPVPVGPEVDPGRASRISSIWIGMICFGVVLVLLLVFILQNTRSVKISYFTATGSMPLGVALLIAAVAGLLLAAVVASLRILQLRYRTRQAGAPAPAGEATTAAPAAADPSPVPAVESDSPPPIP